MKVLSTLRIGAVLLTLATPGNVARVWQTARLRGSRHAGKRGSRQTMQQNRAFTRGQFGAARERGSNAIWVVIPCHNEEQHLPSTLAALARNGNLVPVVVDNNSTDNTAKVADNMGAVVLSQREGRKMAATQCGMNYVLDEVGARRMLFTDGDTLALAAWAAAMERELQRLDAGQGAAVFGASIKWFGRSRLTDTMMTALGLAFTIRRAKRGEAPIARGHNYGLLFDRAGKMRRAINKLDPNVFAGPGHDVPDDTQILLAVQGAGAAVGGVYKPDTWVVTTNDRVSSFGRALATLRPGVSHADMTDMSYAQQYNKARKWIAK